MIWNFLSADIVIEEARLDACSALADIHRNAFSRGWTADEFVRLLQSNGVFGYMSRRPATLFRPATKEPKAFVLTRIAADEAEILTIAVASDARELGLGKALMHRTMDELYANRIESLFLEVDETNLAAIRLYKGLGFQKVGTRQSYYPSKESSNNTGQTASQPAHALVMRCDLR